MRGAVLLFCAVFVLALLPAAAARGAGFSRQDLVLTMDDGVGIAATLYKPDGAPPAAGWPAIMMFHGLGGSRSDSNKIAESYFANEGYAVLTIDERGHGQSGGLINLPGAREVADERALFSWLTSQPKIDAAHVGAFGVSFGGGYVWAGLRAGIPFAAVEPVITWTDLYEALAPQNLAKSGLIGGFLAGLPAERLDPRLIAFKDAALAGRDMAAIRAAIPTRSTPTAISSVESPVFMLQGRRDFAFDLDQVKAAYRLISTPKRLYLGDLGHAPATNPPAEPPHYLTECREWFDRFLKGLPNGIDKRPPVELARDPWNGRTAQYRDLPATRRLDFRLRGTTTIGASGKTVRPLGRTRTALETFGSATVRVAVNLRGGWQRIVAVLTARTARGETVVSEGGVPTAGLSGRRTLSIRLISDATAIPRGARLKLTLAASSTAQSTQNLLYLNLPMQSKSRLTVGAARLTLPVLKQPVSR